MIKLYIAEVKGKRFACKDLRFEIEKNELDVNLPRKKNTGGASVNKGG